MAGAREAETRMWRTARHLGEFTPSDLSLHSSCEAVVVTDDAARRYCQTLMRGGYVRAVAKAVPGVRPARYRVVKATGPQAPRSCRVRAIWDPNTRTFAHIAEPGS